MIVLVVMPRHRMSLAKYGIMPSIGPRSGGRQTSRPDGACGLARSDMQEKRRDQLVFQCGLISIAAASLTCIAYARRRLFAVGA
jgi:hypothetical protein